MWWGLAVLLMVPGTSVGAAEGPSASRALSVDSSCRDPLPIGLDLALPLRGTPRANPRTIEEGVQAFFRSLYQEQGRCSGTRDLQVNIAFGDDYQILHWLEQGLVDAAVVPELSLDLLRQGGLDLSGLPIEGRPGAEQVAPGWTTRVRSTLFTAASAGAQSHPIGAVPGHRRGVEADLDSLLARTVCAADCVGARESPARHPFVVRKACIERCAAGAPPIRLVVDGYLASSALPALVGDLAPRVATTLLSRPADEREAFEALVWQLLLDQTVFLEGGAALAWPPPLDAEGEPVEQWVSVEWRGVETARGAAGLGRDRLVFRSEAAEEFGLLGWRPRSRLDRPVIDLFVRREEPAPARDGPTRSMLPATVSFESRSPAFDALLEPDPYYGVRTFAFSLPEARALLARNQRNSGRDQLALVLPGGGVKAIYQSKVVDTLYGSHYLRNALHPIPAELQTAAPRDEPLAVQHVIGTSGGALLGSFVARLGTEGPWNLTDILWQRDDGRPLRSVDVFGWDDILRYATVVALFLVFCAVLLVASFAGWLPTSQRETVEPSWRPHWMVPMSFLLVLAPLVLRQVSGSAARQHIPAIEGFFFAFLVGLAMFGDQCLVRRQGQGAADAVGDARRSSPLPGWFLLASGLVFMAVPLAARGGTESGLWIDRRASFGAVFWLLLPVLLLAGLVFPVRGLPSGSFLARARQLARLLWEPVLAVSVAVALATTAASRALFDQMPLIFSGSVLVLLLLLGPRILGRRFRRRPSAGLHAVYLGVLMVAAWLLMGLARPADAVSDLFTSFLQPSRLDIAMGPFLVCLGFALCLAGLLLVLATGRGYRIDRRGEFVVGLVIALGHVVAVYAVLLVFAFVPGRLSPLELVGELWFWLLGTGLVLAIAFVLFGRYGRLVALRRLRWSAPAFVYKGMVYLAGVHPNGGLVRRRCLRMASLATLGFAWWNLVLAPALYGNQSAFETLERANEAFARSFFEAHAAAGPSAERQQEFSAHFLAPANALERDGTRYFLFVPPSSDCPHLSTQPGTGSRWYIYHQETGADGGDPTAAHHDSRRLRCQPLAGEPGWQLLNEVVFASGSPFPIFPARELELAEEPGATPGLQALVDGGYSNNIPVDAALAMGAEQVLIVKSSHDLAGEREAARGASTSRSTLWGIGGPLMANLKRLPGFLFERSQQVDRLSRGDLFVVSLSPDRDEPHWPPLFDFRETTMRRLREAAERDVIRRSASVESWGRPRIRLSVRIAGTAATLPPGVSSTAREPNPRAR